MLTNKLCHSLQDAEEVGHLWTGCSLPVGNQSLCKETPHSMRLFEIQSIFLFFFFKYNVKEPSLPSEIVFMM